MRRILPLDEEDADGEEEPTLKVNKAFADRLAHNKHREALHRLQELQNRGIVDSSDEDEEEDDEGSSDDGLLPERTDARIFETLSKIKLKDPSIYSADSNFFDEDDSGVEADTAVDKLQPHPLSNGLKYPHKPVYLKDAIAKQLMEDGSILDEDLPSSRKKRVLTYADEQEALKNEFLNSVNFEDGDEADETGGFFKLRRREQSPVPVKEEEAAPYVTDIAQRLEDYFGKDENLNENDKFLKTFLLKKGWVDEDEDRIPSYEEIVGEMMEDEEELEKQDRFEAEYNFRLEESTGSEVMGHSRLVDDSVRRKDDTRRQKREKKKKRLSEAAFERREELKQLKNIKKKEILERLKMIQAIAGAKETDKDLVQEEDLEEEFNPEEYDRKMREAFGQEYYGAEDVDEKFQGYDMDDLGKPNFNKEDEVLGLQKGWNIEGDADGAVGGFSATHRKVNARKLRDINQKNGEGELEDDLGVSDRENCDVEDCETPQVKGASKRKRKANISLHEKLAFDKQLEEYYKLDYEDVIGDLLTRFKYHQVKPNMFGLTTTEILKADDKDLNQFVSLKKIVPYVMQEWKPKWRFQSSQKMRKKKALSQHAPNRKVGLDAKAISEAQLVVPNQGVPGAEGSKNKKRRRKKGLSLSESRLIAYGKISLPSKRRKRA